jgi:hypothetical protein
VAGRRRDALAGLLLLAGPVLLCGRSLLGDPVFAGADLVFATPFFGAHAPPGFTRPANPLAFDVAYQFVPWRRFAWESLRQGELPLWNPLSLAGAPFVATMQSAVFFPLNLLLTAVPFAATFAWSALVRLWIAGFATYALGRTYGLGMLASLVSGTAFMLCGFLMVWLGHPHTNVAVFLPLLLLIAERLLAADDPVRRRRLVVAMAVVIGVQFTGGHIETSVDALFALAVFWLLRWWQVARPGRAGIAVLPLVAIVLGTGLAAVQLFPFLEWLPLSAEWARRPPRTLALFHRGCWREILALPLAVFPNLYGHPRWPGPYRSYLPWGNYNENVLYVGTVPLLLALVALRARWRDAPPVRVWAGIGLVAAGMMLRLPPFDWLNALPGLARANPARLRLVSSFALALLAGFGLDALRDPGARRLFSRLALAVAGAGIVVAIAGHTLLPLLRPRLLAWGHAAVAERYAALPAPTRPVGYYHDELDAIVAGMVHAFRVTNLAMYLPALVAAVGWVVVRRLYARAAPALAVLTAAELLALGCGLAATTPASHFYPPTHGGVRLASDRALFRTTALGEHLVPDAHMMYGLHDVRGLDFPTVWYASYLDAAGRTPWIAYGSILAAADSPLVRVLNLKYVVGREETLRGMPATRGVEAYGDVAVAELAAVQPRSFLVGAAVTAADDAVALALLRAEPEAVYSRVILSAPGRNRPRLRDPVTTSSSCPTEPTSRHGA